MVSKVLDLESYRSDSFGLAQYLKEVVEQDLESCIRSAGLPERLASGVEYAAMSGGKRIRPLMVLLLCNDLGGEVQRVVRAASALELLHCASLVHDDLPPLDDDDERRGKPSCHKVYGEGQAVIIGDCMPALALSWAGEAELDSSINISIVNSLSRAYLDLCAGQHLDISPGSNRQKLNALKTGALFRCAAATAALGAGRGGEVVSCAEALGSELGLLFQAVDDRHDGEASATAKQDEAELSGRVKELIDELGELADGRDSFSGLRYIFSLIQHR